MKKLLLLALAFFTFSAYAQDSTAVTVQDTAFAKIDVFKFNKNDSVNKVIPKASLRVPFFNKRLREIIAAQEVVIATKDSIITIQGTEIDVLTSLNNELQVASNEQLELIAVKDALLLTKDTEIASLTENNNQLQTTINQQLVLIENKDGEILTLQNNITTLQNSIDAKDTELTQLSNQLSVLTTTNQELLATVNQQVADIEAKDVIIAGNNTQIANLTQANSQLTTSNVNLQNTVTEQLALIAEKDAQIADLLANGNAELQAIIDEQLALIASKNVEITQLNSTISEQLDLIAAKDIEITQLTETNQILQDSIIVLNQVEAEITVIRFASNKTFVLNAPLAEFEFGNTCDSLIEPFRMVTKLPFDFRDIPVRLQNTTWTIEDAIYNNGVQLSVMDAMIQGLIEVNCLLATVVYSGPVLEENFIDKYLYGEDSDWTIDGNSYIYTKGVDNHRYLGFDTGLLSVGETYNISFDVETAGTGRFDMWLYAPDGTVYPPEFQDPRISEFATPVTQGPFNFTYTVEFVDRNKFAIRAQNFGDSFTIRNLKITRE